MHPEISRRYGEQHRAELYRQAERWRLAARPRRPRPARLAMLWTAGPFAARRVPALWRRRGHGAGAPQAAPLGVFLAGPDAFGFRTYLTTARRTSSPPTGRPCSPGSATGRRTHPAVPTMPCSSKSWCWGARFPIWWPPAAGCRDLTARDRPTDVRALLAHRDARFYLAGQALSTVGDNALWLAMGIWARRWSRSSTTGSSCPR